MSFYFFPLLYLCIYQHGKVLSPAHEEEQPQAPTHAQMESSSGEGPGDGQHVEEEPAQVFWAALGEGLPAGGGR